MTLTEILADAKLAEQVWPEVEAFYAAGKALYEKIETVKATADTLPPVA